MQYRQRLAASGIHLGTRTNELGPPLWEAPTGGAPGYTKSLPRGWPWPPPFPTGPEPDKFCKAQCGKCYCYV
ncbi:hypothetical protein PspLS_00553 [Pyricularia sp. CBS 133598]|nr:hypothetical protein PspLS_00553 [Pyricularia sp. CBS 133598]